MIANSMNLQDLANIGQVIGAIAMVLSLFYVGFRTRQNTAAVRSATAQAMRDKMPTGTANCRRIPKPIGSR